MVKKEDWTPFNEAKSKELMEEVKLQFSVIENSGLPMEKISQERLTKLAIALRDLKKEIGKLSVTECYWCGGKVIMGHCENDHNAMFFKDEK